MSFLHKFVRLCSGFAPYRDVLNLSLASSIGYLLRVIAIASLILAVVLVPRVFVMLNEGVAMLAKRMPAFSLNNGKVSTSVDQPYRAGDDKFLFILDTTGQVEKPDPSAASGVLVNADSFAFWIRSAADKSEPAAQRHSLRGFPDGEVNAAYLRRLISLFLWLGTPIGTFLLFLGAVFVTLGQAWLFALAASYLERGMTHALGYPQLFNLAIHAVTPGVLVFTVYAMFQLKGVDLWLLYLIAYGFFLIGAANTCRRPADAEQHPSDEQHF